MQTKKYKHADLERKRSVFFQIGLIIALASVFIAFEWTSDKKEEMYLPDSDQFVEELDLPEIIKLEEKLPEPEKKQEVLAQIFKLTNNEDPNAGTIDFTTEYKENTPIQIPEMKEEQPDDEIHFIVERMPEYPGGMEALMKYFGKHIRYPAICVDLGIEGKVFVSFVIDKDGSVTNVKALRSPDANLTKEAIRVVSNMPKWNPGKQGGRAVRVEYTVPVYFKLQ